MFPWQVDDEYLQNYVISCIRTFWKLYATPGLIRFYFYNLVPPPFILSVYYEWAHHVVIIFISSRKHPSFIDTRLLIPDVMHSRTITVSIIPKMPSKHLKLSDFHSGVRAMSRPGGDLLQPPRDPLRALPRPHQGLPLGPGPPDGEAPQLLSANWRAEKRLPVNTVCFRIIFYFRIRLNRPISSL